MALVEVHAGRHAGGEDVLPLAGEAELPQAVDIVLTRAGGVVGQIDVFFSEPWQVFHQLNGALVDVVAQIERPVHVEQKQLGISQFLQVHIFPLVGRDQSSPQSRAHLTAFSQPRSSSLRRDSSIFALNTRSTAQLLLMSSRLDQ